MRLDEGLAHIMAASGAGNTLTVPALSFNRPLVKYWEITADNLSRAGWSWGIVSAIDCEGRTIWIADAHRDDGKRFVVRADEILTAFLELELAVRSGRIPRGLQSADLAINILTE